jgi:hypothetical protein
MYNQTTIFKTGTLFSGREITQTIIRMQGYKSISGNYIRIDSSGDSEGNFTAFAVKPHNYTFVSRITKKVKFSCSYYPVKVNNVNILEHLSLSYYFLLSPLPIFFSYPKDKYLTFQGSCSLLRLKQLASANYYLLTPSPQLHLRQ